MTNSDDFIKLLLAIPVLLFFAVMIALGWPGAFVDNSKSVTMLSNLGFTHITQTKRDNRLVQFHGCGEKDVVRFQFQAVNSAGKVVAISTCQGWLFKGATIRQ